ncbi:hypothetical protein GCM10027049_29750 [Mucilaginibacter puniceus]
MKKTLLGILFTVGVISIVIVFILKQKTSPANRLKQQFNIDISDRDFTIGTTSEQWLANGDGYYYVEIIMARTENVTNDLIANNFKPLPVNDNVPASEFSTNWEEVNKGFYQFGLLDSDLRNFKIAVYDSEHNKIFFYYEIN